MPNEIAPNVLSWASELDELTTEQAARTARLPILAGHLALMPDAHFGMGATIGSVIATETVPAPYEEFPTVLRSAAAGFAAPSVSG